MTTDEYWTVRELRLYIKVGMPTQDRTWYRLRPLFAAALRTVGKHRIYNAAKVRDIIEGGRMDRRSPVHKSTVLRRVG